MMSMECASFIVINQLWINLILNLILEMEMT